jgi:hypothetical protein
MLKIIARPTFTATVAVNTANVQGDLQVTFVALRTSAITKIEQAAIEAGQNPQDAVLLAVVQGFDPVELPPDDGRDTGSTLYFTGPASVTQLCDWPGIGPAILRRYYSAVWEERRGNSERLPDGSMTLAPAQPTPTPTPPSP